LGRSSLSGWLIVILPACAGACTPNKTAKILPAKILDFISYPLALYASQPNIEVCDFSSVDITFCGYGLKALFA
jgi:hypothetical protein